MMQESNLLSDEQMRDFIVNGHITVKTDLPRSVHETIYRRNTGNH